MVYTVTSEGMFLWMPRKVWSIRLLQKGCSFGCPGRCGLYGYFRRAVPLDAQEGVVYTVTSEGLFLWMPRKAWSIPLLQKGCSFGCPGRCGLYGYFRRAVPLDAQEGVVYTVTSEGLFLWMPRKAWSIRLLQKGCSSGCPGRRGLYGYFRRAVPLDAQEGVVYTVTSEGMFLWMPRKAWSIRLLQKGCSSGCPGRRGLYGYFRRAVPLDAQEGVVYTVTSEGMFLWMPRKVWSIRLLQKGCSFGCPGRCGLYGYFRRDVPLDAQEGVVYTVTSEGLFLWMPRKAWSIRLLQKGCSSGCPGRRGLYGYFRRAVPLDAQEGVVYTVTSEGLFLWMPRKAWSTHLVCLDFSFLLHKVN